MIGSFTALNPEGSLVSFPFRTGSALCLSSAGEENTLRRSSGRSRSPSTRSLRSGPDVLPLPMFGVDTWQPDEEVTHCPICGIGFLYPLCRRHHCRRCGRVVCADCSRGEEIKKTCAWCLELGVRVVWKADPPTATDIGPHSLWSVLQTHLDPSERKKFQRYAPPSVSVPTNSPRSRTASRSNSPLGTFMRSSTLLTSSRSFASCLSSAPSSAVFPPQDFRKSRENLDEVAAAAPEVDVDGHCPTLPFSWEDESNPSGKINAIETEGDMKERERNESTSEVDHVVEEVDKEHVTEDCDDVVPAYSERMPKFFCLIQM